MKIMKNLFKRKRTCESLDRKHKAYFINMALQNMGLMERMDSVFRNLDKMAGQFRKNNMSRDKLQKVLIEYVKKIDPILNEFDAIKKETPNLLLITLSLMDSKFIKNNVVHENPKTDRQNYENFEAIRNFALQYVEENMPKTLKLKKV